MADDDGDGIWTTVLELGAGNFEYKYSVDNFAGRRIIGDGACAAITDGATYANRLVEFLLDLF